MRNIDLDAQLDHLEAEGVIDLADVDFHVRSPDLVRERLGSALDYFARVEREVERNLLEIAAFLPQASPQTRRFVDIWSAQELPHGEIFETLKERLELPPSTPDLSTVSPTLKVAGRLAFIPGVGDVLLFLYLTMGAMHERLTAIGYDRLRDRFLEIGETGFATTGVQAIRKQESGHYAYYRNAAFEVRSRLAGWQLHIARAVRIATYQPIGVRTRLTGGARPADFGLAAVQLTGSPEIDDVAVPVQRVAQELLVRESQGARLPLFVQRALREAVAAARRANAGSLPGLVQQAA